MPHTAAIGIEAERVERTIEQQITEDCYGASSTGSFWGRLVVDHVLVEYRAYTLSDGSISVGTYYAVKVN